MAHSSDTDGIISIIFLLVFFPALALAFYLDALTIMYGWNHMVVPLGTPSIDSMWHAYGLSCLIGFATISYPPDRDWETRPKGK